MRDVIVLIVVFLLVFGGDFLIKKYLEKSSADFIEHFDEMSGDFERNYDDKLLKVKEIIDDWEKKESPWIIFEYHDSINDIEDMVIETYSHYLNNNREEFDISYRKLIRLIDDLKNRVDLSFENVL